MKVETEIWQVETRDGVYQADLPTLKQWVAEGLVLPTDRVRKGALKWIEAGRAPMLRRVFAGEERVEVVAPTPQAEHAGAGTQSSSSSSDFAPGSSPDMGLEGDEAHVTNAGPSHDSFTAAGPSLSSSCHFHPLQAATLVCRSCSATFCRACPNRVGTSSVLLCALCGGFCDPLEILTERLELYRRQSEGFGVEDFRAALAYPFKHLASLLGGALLYGVLLLAGMRAQILASALVFGCIALVVKRVAYGDLKRDFLPDFSEFSFWDDVVVPCSLGVGVTLVTLGPTLVLVGMLVFGWVSQSKPQLLPTDHPALAAAEGREMKDEPFITPEEFRVMTEGGTEEQQARVAEKIEAMGPDARGLEAPRGGEEHAAVYACRLLLTHPGLVLLLGLVTLAWAVFYYPMALLVAGWTESLKSVLNPLVGLDTIRHMGLNYFKAFLMYLGVQAVALVFHFFVGLLTAPFEMPLVGNLPGTFLGGVVTFYTSLVVACVLGLALFKSADRLGIEID
ncbi:MAG TPA: hypothetical protein VF297_14535 [Pyrinomonadaceae bacterium]